MGNTNLLLVAVLALAGGADAAERVPDGGGEKIAFDLRPHFVAGRSSRYSFWETRVIQTTVTGPGGERTAELSMTTEGTLLWRVLGVADDGSADCVIQFDHVVVTVQSPGADPRVMDSREPGEGENRINRWLTALLATPLHFRMMADGSVQRFESLDEILAAVEADRPGLGASMFIEQASTLATIPGAPAQASVGATWERPEQWSRDYGGFPVRLEYDGKYGLETVTRIAGIDVAMVRGDADLAGAPDVDRIPPNAPPIDMEIHAGTATSRIMFDLASHEVVGSDSVETVSVNVVMSIRDVAINTRIDERVHSQILRIAEVDEEFTASPSEGH